MSVVADKLREARTLVKRGWCQHRMFTADGCVCVRGALLAVFAAEDDTEETYADEVFANALLQRAVGFNGYLGHWNDSPGRTQAEVLAAFDKAIELAEAGND